MKAVRFVDKNGNTRIGCLNDNGTVRDCGTSGHEGFVPTEEAWEMLSDTSGTEYPTDQIQLLHPVQPGKIVAIGLNYRSHADESELDVPAVPVVFSIFPSALIGPEADIVIPKEETRPDYEGELAIVIGKKVYRPTREEARAAVGGISAFNDVSGRRAQLETPLRQFTLGKSFDTFAPMGPCIRSAKDVDLANIQIRTTVSGEVMQDANTRDLIFPVEDIIMYCSSGMTLYPGDVIATGTPGGVGDSRNPRRYLHEGDIVEVYVEGVGTLRNSVVEEK
ncbi:fumarylacetoacetate hydrolase family protein [Ferviditalea candida]|uniref:Fumarylacetoacetate hydrolase family protein n=1 Tax=Ferviditalea candida TaxID=3108399 RepID=A0ABU5ZQ95_9BACL|nr:fumarylacetoacetate hydrolase family protein [Paenibacillaceae bacterium T2]